jgi:Fe-coproporphyrin III synthase
VGKAIKWDLTNKCNLRCIHCSAAGSHFTPNVRKLSLAEKLRVADNLASADVTELTLIGGEPMTSKDFFPVASYAASKGIAVTPPSPGALI